MRYIFSLLVCTLLFSCVSTGDFERLRNDVNSLQRDHYETKREISLLKEKTSAIVREDTFSAVRESQAETTARVSELSSSLQELRGRFEENRYFTEKTLKESGAEKDLLKAQITSLENQIKAIKDKFAALEQQIEKFSTKPQEPVKSDQIEKQDANAQKPETQLQPKEPEKKGTEDNKTKAYNTALEAFKDKKYKVAREQFEGFLKENPKHELSDNAQFWIAETYYAEKDFESAILAYETLMKKYPDSTKGSAALLKQGYAFIEIGDVKTGKIILNKLIEKYPSSIEAEKAKKKIAELENKHNKAKKKK